ncbi:MAG: nucleoside-diphosphate sugar epimerase [Hyphococcus sp.]|nr:MAG: nucleoside-diphosphate sugar epimerase [Marinicaulis sp.]
MHHATAIATGRDTSLFASDLRDAADALREAVCGARILAVGAAGSIGSNTVHTLAAFAPKTLHIVDQNENALAELVRQVRSAPTPFPVEDFRTLPLDYGSAATHALMAAEGPYDYILNFAAIKHVRSEKDPYSILQMFDTNIVKQARFRRWIAELSPQADYFSVSTDKAANPVSFMGATKRVMEHVLFDSAKEIGLKGKVTTARFANVAFSNGSLLQAFEQRLARKEPIACPKNIQRYFVSLEESGHICALASVIAPHAHIAIPRLDPKDSLVLLEDIARAFIEGNGLQAVEFDDERAACEAAAALHAEGRYPLLLTPADTAGEKPYEEFVGEGEETTEIGLKNMLAVYYKGVLGSTPFADVLTEMEEIVLHAHKVDLAKSTLKDLIGRIEPRFLAAHIESTRNLDQRA